jgi:hypothetical protein
MASKAKAKKPFATVSDILLIALVLYGAVHWPIAGGWEWFLLLILSPRAHRATDWPPGFWGQAQQPFEAGKPEQSRNENEASIKDEQQNEPSCNTRPG